MPSKNIEILNLTSPVGFTQEAIAAMRASKGVHELEATPDADGRYRDIWMHVTPEFNRHAFEQARRGV